MTEERKLKLPALTRDMSCELLAVDGDTLTFPFASETPVERMFGEEILSHAKGAMRLDRFESGAVPLLWNHDWDQPIGMVPRAWIDKDRRSYAEVKFFDTARAKEVKSMVKGGLRNVSVGYRLIEVEEHRDGSYTATSWEPFEISIVSVPADATVGVGRTADAEERTVRVLRADPPAEPATTKESEMTEAVNAPAGATADVQVIDHAAPERLRIKTLQTLARTHKIDDGTRDSWIDEGVTSEEAAQKVLDIIAERAARNPSPSPAQLNLTPSETRRYSFTRAIQATVSKNWANAGFELECSRAIQQKLGKVAGDHTFYVPLEIQQRDMIVGTSTMGGYLVSTGNVGFIDLLRNRSVAYTMGATRLSGLQGSVTVPKITAPGTGYWLATEATAITESQMVIGQMALTPKNVGGYTEISRQLLLQGSPSAELLVMNDLAAVLGLALDVAVLRGTGTTQPLGIIETGGIGGVTIGTGGIDYEDILEFQTDAAGANALSGNSGYVSTPTIAALLKRKARFNNSDTPIWQGNVLDGNIEGLRAMSSNQMSTGQLLFGDFSQVVIAEWGVLEVEANPYANFAVGIVGVRAFLTADVGVRYPAAFSLGTGITA